MIAVSQHNDLSVKYIGKFTLFGAKHRKHEGVFNLRIVKPWIVEGQIGSQVTDNTAVIFARDALMGINTGTTGKNRNEKLDLDFDLYKYATEKQISTTLYTAVDVPVNEVLYAMNAYCNLSLLSMTSCPQIVTLYIVTPKYDTSTDPVTYFNNVVADRNQGQIPQVVATTKAVATYTSGYASWLDYGQNPFHYWEYRKNWRCLKKYTVLLQPGDQHNISWEIVFNKIISREILTQTRKDQYLANITIVPMMVVRGGLVGVAPTGALVPDAATEVTYSQCKVGTLFNYQLKLAQLPATRFSQERTGYAIVEADTTDNLVQLNDVDTEMKASLV